MATLDDLFGSSKPRRAPSPKWPTVGTHHDAVLSGEAYIEQQVELDGGYEKKYLEEIGGKWSPKKESELTEGSVHSPLMQIVVPVRLLADESEATLYFDTQAKKKALKEAMQSSGLALIEGTGIRMTHTHMEGKRKGWSVQLAAPKK